MGQALIAAFPAARQVFNEVDDALSLHLSKIIRDGSESELTLTENAQPALMAVSLAVVGALEAELGQKLATRGAFAAGHSLGEYSALAAFEAFDLADAARLLQLRGRAMQQAVPVGAGAMAALFPITLEAAEEIVAEAAEDEICVIANDNGAGQIVLSGAAEAIDRAVALAEARKIKRAIRLDVSAPFHSPLLEPAARAMENALAKINIAAPRLPIISNVTAAPVDQPETIRELLVQQVTARVRWRESIEYLVTEGVDIFAELGHGSVLTGLARRIAPAATALSVAAPADFEHLLKLL